MSDKDQNPKTTTHSIEDGIAGRLKAARESMGLSQTDIHKITGLSRMVISKYESGQNKPGTRELRLLCDALKISPNHLIYGTENPHKLPESIAETLLNMGQQAVVPAATIIPIISSVLGTDDIRAILNLAESLLKAKSPEHHAMVTELLQVFQDSIIPNKEALLDPEKSAEVKEKLQKEMQDRLLAAAMQKK
ncbi:helix-turn-helix transcriptional regulator [Methylophilus sp. YYY-1]|uniref:helix-turn-helix domain-containing protein n=1 Tax=Methylophilus sp. YYY-1 TaxID=2682087 RepID=UPI0023B2EF10|nr:helix-turn-helix transcriptional regulator [Methylophilus sp. YYY-1]MDF0379364.1 helix-turn-helix domain-containing protein [Methylophilus sp. YYY-1]